MNRLIPAAILCLVAPLAQAEITAAEAWEAQAAYYAATGAVMEATVTQDATSMTVADITLTYTLPFGAGSVVMTRGGLVLTDADDGIVTLTHEEMVPLTISADLNLGRPISLRAEMEVGFTEHSGTVERIGDAVKFHNHADMTVLTLTGLTITGVPLFAGMTATGTLSVQDGGIETRIAKADGHTSVRIEMGSETVSADITIDAPDDQTVRITRTTEGIDSDLIFARPDTFPPDASLSQLLGDGYGFRFTFTASHTQSDTIAKSGDTVIWQQAKTVGRFVVDTGLLEDRLVAEVNLIQLNLQQPAGIQFDDPLSLSVGRTVLSMQLPVLQLDTPQDLLRIGMGIEQVTANEALWAFIDPQQVLPRDPVSAKFTLFGKAIVLADFLDPAVLTALINDRSIPMDVTATPIFAIDLSGLGAAIKLDGDFTYDNSDLTTPVSMRTMGQMTVELTGVVDLLDNLLNTGFFAPEQLAPARAFLDVYTLPDDTGLRTAVVDFALGGGFTVNGQPVP